MKKDPLINPTREQVLGLAASVEGGMGLLALVFSSVFGFVLFPDFVLNPSVLSLSIVLTIPVLCLFMTVRLLPFETVQITNTTMDELLKPIIKPCSFGDLAVISILAGLGEEMLFRGVLQYTLYEQIGPYASIIAVGLLFGATHYISMFYAILATSMGIYLGSLFFITENLWVPTIVHSFYDFVILVILKIRWQKVTEETT
ncbi:MAG: CPBP family intramembrane metalloprotease [Candidatus Lindowbacteria bacterium]|nr:CPBP family intramembrane metalloprotease [Candidatus Lindowbacteria bacterium]